MTHVLFGTHRGPHIVRPSRPHKLVIIVIIIIIIFLFFSTLGNKDPKG